MQYKYLLMVTAQNNNKYYEMKQLNENQFISEFGRVGYHPQKHTWPMRKWESTYNSKLKKGYKDVTDFRVVAGTGSSLGMGIPTDSPIVQKIFETLLAATSQSVSKNYNMSIEKVTQQMVDDAQGYIDELSQLSFANKWSEFNETLLQLFVTIPRRMEYVPDNLLSLSSNDPASDSREIIQREQDTLDGLKGQVIVSSVGEEDSTEDLFDAMGIAVQEIEQEDRAFIHRLLEDDHKRYVRAIKVTNKKTRERFNAFLESCENKQTKTLWHGSRNQNWISLLEKGIILNPNAIRTGDAFGRGLYFAPRAAKSIGYTSLRGSYWTNGSENCGFMGLYNVHVGKPYTLYSGDSSLNYDYIKGKGFDSTHAIAGQRLLNDEIVVYKTEQVDIQYLVELN